MEHTTISTDYNRQIIENGKGTGCHDSNYSTYSWSNNGDRHMVCSNIIFTLFVPANINITVESISGDIELVGMAGPVRAKSINGFVDLSWPLGKLAAVDLKTISGEAFTNVEDIQLTNKKDHIAMVGYQIKGTIGTGGPVVSLESISGNIYLREGNS